MKFQRIETTTCHDEHERFVMHIGREEVRVLMALMEDADKLIPKIKLTTQLCGRIHAMHQDFKKVMLSKSGESARTKPI